ncbi:MAG: hypothetical protein HY017_23590 [Betaproteobacteria bacterium]|nr:hypothetical protein [Betaproteobacteria bacterium]
MIEKHKLLIVDDDDAVIDYLQAKLRERYPSGRRPPSCPGRSRRWQRAERAAARSRANI